MSARRSDVNKPHDMPHVLVFVLFHLWCGLLPCVTCIRLLVFSCGVTLIYIASVTHTHLTLHIWLLGPLVGAIVCRRNFIRTHGGKIVVVGCETLPVATERRAFFCHVDLHFWSSLELGGNNFKAWPCRSSLLVSHNTPSPPPLFFCFVYCWDEIFSSESDSYY